MKRAFTFLLVIWGCAFGGMLGFWIQDRAVPVDSKVVEIVGHAVPGQKLLVRWKVNRGRSCSATKTELVIDSMTERWVLPAISFPAPPGPMGISTFVSQTEIPADVPLGRAMLWVTLSYSCNPFHALWPVIDQIPGIPVFFERRAEPS